MSLNIEEVQKDLRAAKLDGWLFYDFRGRDPIAQRILQLPPGHAHAPLVLFHSGQRDAAKTGAQNRNGISGGAAGRNALFFRAGRTAKAI